MNLANMMDYHHFPIYAIMVLFLGAFIVSVAGAKPSGNLKNPAGARAWIALGATGLSLFFLVMLVKPVMLGGEISNDLHSINGPLTEKSIADMHFNKAFIGANGYIPDGGVFTHTEREARKKRVGVREAEVTAGVLVRARSPNRRLFRPLDADEVHGEGHHGGVLPVVEGVARAPPCQVHADGVRRGAVGAQHEADHRFQQACRGGQRELQIAVFLNHHFARTLPLCLCMRLTASYRSRLSRQTRILYDSLGNGLV